MTTMEVLLCRTRERRDACPVKVPRFLAAYNWKPLFAINILIAAFYGITYGGLGTYYSIRLLLQDIHQYHIFAPCFKVWSGLS